MQKLKLKIPPVFIVLFFIILIGLLHKIYPLATIHFPSNGLMAMFFIAISILIVAVGALAFRKVKTTVDPRFPNKTNHLVISSIYQYTRNPMYVGMLFALLGVVIFFGSISGVFLLPFFIWTMNELQIKPEEEALLEKFGDSYISYINKVRRWL